MTNEELVELYQQGNKSVIDDLMEQNTGIVNKIINRYYINSNSIDREDLFQEGCIGLILAATKYNFNIEHPCKFITYAVYWINQKINRYLKQKSTSDEISLQTPIGDDERTLQDTLKDNIDLEDKCIENLYNAELRQDLYDSMYKVNTLTEREVLEFNYGLCCTIPMGLQEIGDVLHISFDKAQQEQRRAIDKLRANSYKLPIKRYRDEFLYVRQEIKYKNIDSLIFNWEDKYPELKEYKERYENNNA